MNSGVINVKGYTTPRSFSGFQIPIPLQSMAIRRYCEDRGLAFNHHVAENITTDTYLVLERIVEEAHLYQAIAMCSIGMLPSDSQHRTALFARCLAHKTSIHFLFEQIIVTTESDVLAVDELISLTKLISGPPTRLGNFQYLTKHSS